MTTLTPDQAAILRSTLGLGAFDTTTKSNWMPPDVGAEYPQALVELIELELMTITTDRGATFHQATPEGRRIILAHQPKDGR
jgi:hypothetical protein